MNRLCIDIEKWQRKNIKFKRVYESFDYRIMMDETVDVDEDIFLEIEKVFLEFCREIAETSQFNAKCRNYNKYADYFRTYYPEYPKEFFDNFEINWQVYYNKYKQKCKSICPDKQMLANIAVILCYEKYPTRNKKFIWKVASEGVLLNIKQQNITLPMQDDDGEYEYLGKKYRMIEVYNSDK